jgi:rare lipoprotein A
MTARPGCNRIRGMNRLLLTVVILLAAMVICTCRSIPPPAPTKVKKTVPVKPKPYRVGKYWYHPLPHARDFKEKGIASWYGEDFHGKRTSSGELYDMYALTAAHKTLPLGVFVRVTNLTNHKHIDVRINDRGPFVKGRIIDLSYIAAQKLDIVGPGTAPVEVVALGAPATSANSDKNEKYIKIDYFSGKFTIQIGAFSNHKNAARLKTKLAKDYAHAHIQPHQSDRKIYYRVRVGDYSNLDEAERFEKELNESGYAGAFIVAE